MCSKLPLHYRNYTNLATSRLKIIGLCISAIESAIVVSIALLRQWCNCIHEKLCYLTAHMVRPQLISVACFTTVLLHCPAQGGSSKSMFVRKTVPVFLRLHFCVAFVCVCATSNYRDVSLAQMCFSYTWQQGAVVGNACKLGKVTQVTNTEYCQLDRYRPTI